MRYIYLGGPYLSRRIGVSLGVNILEEYKICTFDCKYCEIGRTPKQSNVPIQTRLSINRDLNKYQKEIESMLVEYPGIDSITFGYYGEPTLADDLYDLVQLTHQIKEKVFGVQERPYISIFTNSSTILLEDVKNSLKHFDQIIFKLDCITQEDFEYFNQPHPETPKLIDIIEGIRVFTEELRKKNSHSKVIIQTLLMKDGKTGKSNYSKDKIIEFCTIYNKINPDEIHIYTVSRPPAYKEIVGITLEEKREIKEIVERYIQKEIEFKVL